MTNDGPLHIRREGAEDAAVLVAEVFAFTAEDAAEVALIDLEEHAAGLLDLVAGAGAAGVADEAGGVGDEALAFRLLPLAAHGEAVGDGGRDGVLFQEALDVGAIQALAGGLL